MENKLHLVMAMAAALVVGGCSANGVKELPGSAGSTASTGEALNTEVRILGTDANGFNLAYFGVRSLTVTAAGKTLAAEVEAPKIDLTNTSQAWLAGKFALPQDATSVTVTLALDEYGAFQNATDAGEVDVQGKPFTFTAPVSFIKNGKVVVDLDLGRSILPARPGAMNLIPQYKLHF